MVSKRKVARISNNKNNSHKKDKENDKYPKKGEIRTLAIALAISKLYELLYI